MIQGEAVEREMAFEGNPIKIKLEIPVHGFLEAINQGGFGPQWTMAYGPVVRELRCFLQDFWSSRSFPIAKKQNQPWRNKHGRRISLFFSGKDPLRALA